MNTTLISQPVTFNPLNTPIWYVALSDWVAVDDFRFNWKVEGIDKIGGVNVDKDYGLFQTPPNPDSIGVFTPIEVITTDIKFTYFQNLSTYTYSTDDWLRFRVGYGFDCRLSLPYYDELFNGDNVSLTFSYPHNLADEMYILIETDSTINPQYNGTICKITSVDNPYMVTTNMPWGSSGPVIGGRVKIPYSDTFNSSGHLGLSFSGTHIFRKGDYLTINKNDKSINKEYDGEWLVLATASNSVVVDRAYGTTYEAGLDGGIIERMSRLNGYSNQSVGIKGVREYKEVSRDFGDTYYMRLNITSSTFSFLTEYTDWKLIPSNQDEEMRVFNLGSTISNLVMKRYFTAGGSDTRQVSFNTSPIAGTTPMMWHVGVGTKNVLTMFGSDALDGVSKYEIYFTSGSVNSESIKREISDFCSPYGVEKILFNNRLGSFETFYFNRGQTRKIDISRNQFKKSLGYNYQIGDRGITNYSMKVSEEYTFKSDWLTETEADFLEELLYSLEAFWMQEDGSKIPIIVTNKDWETKRDINGDMYALELSFRPSYDINTIWQ